ncbi:MAG: T9SS type A sorting domain-containing protein [Cyclobacteriaceae bacterium]|nr:T9SS type A sorting domain-containing protein [Cyclobacteriaceae bacterium]
MSYDKESGRFRIATPYKTSTFSLYGNEESTVLLDSSGIFMNVAGVVQTADGGFLIGATANASTWNPSDLNDQNYGDWYLTKIDSSGNRMWENYFGGTKKDLLADITVNDVGEILLAGSSRSNVNSAGFKSSDNIGGSQDGWIVKLDATGQYIWDRTIGSSTLEEIKKIVVNSNGDIIIGGSKAPSTDGPYDYWIAKLDALGNISKEKTFTQGRLADLIITADGGYVLGGTSNIRNTVDKTETRFGLSDYWIVRLNESMNKVWNKTLGGYREDELTKLLQTSDGEFVVGGYSQSSEGGNVSDFHGTRSPRFWIVKLNAFGKVKWDKSGEGGWLIDLFETKDKKLILGGIVHSENETYYGLTELSSYESNCYVISPVDGATGIKNYTDVQARKLRRAKQYTIELSTDSSFATIDKIQTDNQVKMKFTGLAPSTTYFARVKTDFVPGEYGKVTKFSTDSTINLVAYLNTPADGDSGISRDTKLFSREVTGATDYTIQLGEDSLFTIVVYDSTKADRMRQVKNLKFNTTYYCQVKTDINTQFGPITKFTTRTAESLYYVKSPLCGSTIEPEDAAVELNKVSGATWYLVELSEVQDFAEITATQSGNGTSYFFDQLRGGSTYYLRYKTDLSSNYSDICTFATVSDEIPYIQWDQTIGGSYDDTFSNIIQTSDGGYILGGYSYSNKSGDMSENSKGGYDYWLVKLLPNGVKEWDKTIGGSSSDYLYGLQQTTDGGYILGGYSNSDISGDKSQNSRGGWDYWVVKLSPSGMKEWDKTFGGSSNDYLNWLQQTTDGGYILGGRSNSSQSGNKSENSKGGDDYWVVKLSPSGMKEWDKTIGGSRAERINELQQTADGGYILGGYSESNISGDKSENSKGYYDYWVVKLTPSGVKEWDKTIGGNYLDYLEGIKQTTDGGYILGGYSYSNKSGDKSENSKGGYDYWVVKLLPNGAKEWDKTIGGSSYDVLYELQQTTDGGYILGGSSNSNQSGDKSENYRGSDLYVYNDYWVVKLSPENSRGSSNARQGTNISFKPTEEKETQLTNVQFDAEVFPNPFTQELNLRIYHPEHTKALVVIRSTTGQQVFSEVLNTNTNHSIATALTPGLYFLSVQVGNELRTMKVVKM